MSRTKLTNRAYGAQYQRSNGPQFVVAPTLYTEKAYMTEATTAQMLMGSLSCETLTNPVSTATLIDSVSYCDPSAASITVTLPDPTTLNTESDIKIGFVKSFVLNVAPAGNTVTIVPTTPGAAANSTLSAQSDGVSYVWTGLPGGWCRLYGGSGMGPVLSPIPVARSAFVSAETGSDATGLVERFDRMFATIQAAQTAVLAAQGANEVWTVYVYGGDYTGTVQCRNNINLCCMGTTRQGRGTTEFIAPGVNTTTVAVRLVGQITSPNAGTCISSVSGIQITGTEGNPAILTGTAQFSLAFNDCVVLSDPVGDGESVVDHAVPAGDADINFRNCTIANQSPGPGNGFLFTQQSGVSVTTQFCTLSGIISPRSNPQPFVGGRLTCEDSVWYFPGARQNASSIVTGSQFRRCRLETEDGDPVATLAIQNDLVMEYTNCELLRVLVNGPQSATTTVTYSKFGHGVSFLTDGPSYLAFNDMLGENNGEDVTLGKNTNTGSYELVMNKCSLAAGGAADNISLVFGAAGGSATIRSCTFRANSFAISVPSAAPVYTVEDCNFQCTDGVAAIRVTNPALTSIPTYLNNTTSSPANWIAASAAGYTISSGFNVSVGGIGANVVIGGLAWIED